MSLIVGINRDADGSSQLRYMIRAQSSRWMQIQKLCGNISNCNINCNKPMQIQKYNAAYKELSSIVLFFSL